MSLAASDVVDTYMLRFSNMADFVIAMGPQKIGVWAAPGTSMETLRHLLLDQVLPRVLAQQGRVVLHAGSVKIGDEVIAFVGETGSGKSTLTASFHAANYPLLSDDCLLLTPSEDSTLCLPTYPCIRLWPEAIDNLYAQAPQISPMAHYSNKQRLISDTDAEYNSLQSCLTAIYLLASEPSIDNNNIIHNRLSSSEACIEIIRNSFHLDPTNRLLGSAAFEKAINIVETVPFFTLYYKRKYALIGDLISYILENQKLINRSI